MKRLCVLKVEYAIEKGYNDWYELIGDTAIHRREDHYDRVTELYAREVAQASLHKAAENVTLIEQINGEDFSHWVDKESITNESNITLL